MKRSLSGGELQLGKALKRKFFPRRYAIFAQWAYSVWLQMEHFELVTWD